MNQHTWHDKFLTPMVSIQLQVFEITRLLVYLNTSCKSTASNVTRTNLIGWCKMQWHNNYPIRQCDVIGCIRPIRDTLRCITTYIVTTDLIGWCMWFCLLLSQSETKWDVTAWHPTTSNYTGFKSGPFWLTKCYISVWRIL